STETKQQQQKEQGVGPIVSDRKNVASPTSTSPPLCSRQQQQERQRFALELDGVHCFETIVPY
ncbi:hypothetical protein SGI36_21510, partial [Providencia rettgeri]